jgi:TPR repeat protein
MASRQFLKILQSARFGDVSAQQNLARVYLSGAFNTPIQPANSLVWLEKSYLSIINQSVIDTSSDDAPDLSFSDSLAPIFSLLSTIPLANTVGSPAFPFGWKLFWRLAETTPHPSSSDSALSTPSQLALNTRWQLIQFLLSPEYAVEQARLRDWLASTDLAAMDFMPATDLPSLQLVCKSYLQSLAETENNFTQAAKELLLRLQPKDETLSGLWSQWLASGKQDHLLEAAEMGLTVARLTLGLQLAQLDGVSGSAPTVGSGAAKADQGRSNASLKKAVYWLELAAKDGDRDAWFALGEIYRRPQFSGYNAAESDRCFDRAADLGHAEAQFRKGANLWRRREKLEERVKGLQASYWVWQAQQQGVQEASTLLSKILESCPHPTSNDWHDLALLAEQAINRHAEYKIEYEWLLLCHRLVIANQFHFSKAELLLADIAQLQHEHCVVVDIRWELPKILPRLIQIETIGQRRALLAAGKVFTGSANSELGTVSASRDSMASNVVDDEDELFESREREGNLRQRRYRFDKVNQWLLSTFTKEAATTSPKRK